MQRIVKDYLEKNDKFAKYNNIKVTEVKEGYAVTEMEINENHLNAAGTVHGGAIFSLADLALGAAANSFGVLNLSLNATISYIKTAKFGKLRAIAKKISESKKISVYQVEVKDDKDNLVAVMQGLAYSKDKNTL